MDIQVISSGLIRKLPRGSGSVSPVMDAFGSRYERKNYASVGVLATALSPEVAEAGRRHSGDFVWVNLEIAKGSASDSPVMEAYGFRYANKN